MAVQRHADAVAHHPVHRADQRRAVQIEPARSRCIRPPRARRRSGRASCRWAPPRRQCPALVRDADMFAQMAMLAVHRDQHVGRSSSVDMSPDRGGWHGPRHGNARRCRRSHRTPISEKAFMIRSTSRSLPGMVLDENRKVSPSFISQPQILAARQLRRGGAPFALAAGDEQHQVAARHLQRLFGRDGRAESPVSTPASSRRRQHPLHRPAQQADRAVRRRAPASASVFSRATFEAKVVATTMPAGACDQLGQRLGQRASDRPGWVRKDVGRIADQRLDRALRRRSRQSARRPRPRPPPGCGRA